MRSKIVAGNWKMNLTFEEAETLVDDILEAGDGIVIVSHALVGEPQVVDNLHVGGMHLIDLQLFDIHGHMVEIWEGNIPKTISLAHLPQGSYVLRIHTDDGFLYRKVVKY